MSQAIIALCLVCTVPGFRRAGVAHPAQKTYYAQDFFTEEQLSQLEKELRITVTEVTEVPEGTAIHGAATGKPREATTGTIQGVVTNSGETKDLADLTVPELKHMAQGLGIEEFNGMKKAELIDAIKAVETTAADAE